MYVFGEDNFEIIFEHNKQRLPILMLKYLPCSFLLAQVRSSLSPVIISTLTVIFSLKTISRLSIRLSLIVDNGGLGRGAVGRCRQIRIWLHRAGRARSQKREMKFDRSDRDPLALRSSILVSNPSPPTPSSRAVSLFSSPGRNLESCKMALAHSSPGFPHLRGAPRAPTATGTTVPRACCAPSPPLSTPLSRGAPHFIRFSFICYLPAAAATAAAGYAPSGASAEAGLLSSNPTPFYKYITRPSGPLPRLTPGPTVSYRCPIVTLRCVEGGA